MATTIKFVLWSIFGFYVCNALSSKLNHTDSDGDLDQQSQGFDVNGNDIIHAIRQLREQMNDIREEIVGRINTIEANIGSAVSKIVEIDTKTTKKFEKIEPILLRSEENLGNNIENLKTYISSIIEEKLGKLESEVGNIKTKQDNVGMKVENITTAIGVVGANVVHLDSKITTITLETEGIKTTLGNLTSLSTSVEKPFQNYRSLDSKIVGIGIKTSSMEEKFGKIEPILLSREKKQESYIENLKTYIRNITKDKLGKLESEIGKIKTKEDDIEMEVENITAAIGVMNTNVLSLEPKITTIKLQIIPEKILFSGTNSSRKYSIDILKTNSSERIVTILLEGRTGKCIDNYWANNHNGNPIHLWGCNGTKAQKWIVIGTNANTPYFQLKNVGSGKCIDISNANTSINNGTQLQQQTCGDQYSQQWILIQGRIIGRENRKCFDASPQYALSLKSCLNFDFEL